MFFKRILPIALCFLMLGNYSEGSCVFAEDGKTAEAEASGDREAEKNYELFLKNEQKVHIDALSILGDASCLKKVDGEGISKEKRFVNQITTLIRLILRDASFFISVIEREKWIKKIFMCLR